MNRRTAGRPDGRTGQASRREFISVVTTAGSGLALGVFVPPKFGPAVQQSGGPAATAFAPNAFVRVGTDGTVTVVVGYSEMGQGVLTAVPMLVAEELEVDPTSVKYEQAPAAQEYFNPLFQMQGTGGSTTVRACWEPLRRAGAAAREMLLAAAAQRWSAPRADLAVAGGVVTHGPHRATYGELARAAARQSVPQNVALKPSSAWKVLGRRVKRLDSLPKVTGRAGFGLDTRMAGLKVAVVARNPVFGSPPFDNATAARMASELSRQAGARVVPVPSGFAVVADNYWAALKGRERLEITWPSGPNDTSSSDIVRSRWADLARAGTGAVMVRHEGQGPGALASAARRLDAVYEVPYLAHACMEPMNCTAHVRPGAVDVWAPTQAQTITQQVAGQVAGVPPTAVKVHTTLLGGGFGRRFEMDFVVDAVAASKAVGAPVKLVYSREDDIQHDLYRPAVYNALAAGLDASGAPIAWTHRSVSSSIIARVFPQMFRDGKDDSAYEGAADLPYAIPNIHVDWIRDEPGVPVGFWRSVGNSHTAFTKECFFDEIAAAANTDPLELRRRLLSGSDKRIQRLLGVLNLAAERAGWGSPAPSGTGRGIAVHDSFGSFVAEVAEVRLTSDGTPRVTRVVCAIDCGQIVNPLTIEAQAQSAIVYGLSAALRGAITIERGRVVQSNFHDYAPLFISEMPLVEVHIVPSTEAPGGVGEPATPPIAPAVCNALFALTGKRIRRLPIRAEDLRG